MKAGSRDLVPFGTIDTSLAAVGAKISALETALVALNEAPREQAAKASGQYRGRRYPEWFSDPETMQQDLSAIELAAEERVKLDPELAIKQAILDVIADCLRKNEDPGFTPSGPFIEWNWYRLDCYKLARGEGPLGVPAREVLNRRRRPHLLKAA